MGNYIFPERSSYTKKKHDERIPSQTNSVESFWREIKTQTRLRRIATPPYREKIFYTYDSNENKVSIYHPQEGLFFLTKSKFEIIDKKVRKLLKDDSSGDQFLLLSASELSALAIMKDYFNWQNRVN